MKYIEHSVSTVSSAILQGHETKVGCLAAQPKITNRRACTRICMGHVNPRLGLLNIRQNRHIGEVTIN